MNTIKPRSVDELKEILERARRDGKIVYIAAYPCADCEALEAILETTLSEDELSRIIKIDTPSDDDEIIDFLINDIGIKGAPAIICGDEIIDDFDVYEIAKKVMKHVKSTKKA
jgi:hypothetical protein